MDLQEYGEYLMKNKTGSIVALEPKTGEVLALVSAPTMIPDCWWAGSGQKTFETEFRYCMETLFNRALQASYPPGSTFKPINGLIGLQEKVIEPSTMFGCNNGYLFVKCHSHSSPLDLKHGISNSCNSYFCQTYSRILENPQYPTIADAYTKWKEYLNEFGFGRSLALSFQMNFQGNVPSTAYFDRYYGKNRWKALTVISMAIGQGELGTTPLQMANMTAAIANRGYFYTPHIVKSIGKMNLLISVI